MVNTSGPVDFSNPELYSNIQTKGLSNSVFSDLEKICSSLQPVSSAPPNSIYLSIDPAIDKTPVYSQILQAYKWSNKVILNFAGCTNFNGNHVSKSKYMYQFLNKSIWIHMYPLHLIFVFQAILKNIFVCHAPTHQFLFG